jgi:uncharacterized protein YdgA (DUF945 family)/tetratricopeptide (TPR) repeat protein
MKEKVAIVSVSVLGLAMAAWLGGSLLAANRVQKVLQGMQDLASKGDGSLRITKLTHERGLLSSKGQADLALEPGCSADSAANDVATLRVEYTMSHLILPTSLTRIDWQVTPLSETADDFKALFGTVSSLAGNGSVALDGSLRTDMALPQMSSQRSGSSFQVAPSKGYLAVNGAALAFGWKIDRIVARGGGQAVDARDIVIDLDLKNRYLGTGTARMGIENLSLSNGTLEGLALRSEANEKGDRLDVTVTPSVRRVKGNGVELSELAMEVGLKGLDTRSVETLSKMFEASCGFQNLTYDEGQKAQAAALKLMSRGLSVGIPKFGGKGPDGGISGDLMLELAEAKDGRPSLAAQLKSRGRLEVTGSLLTPEQSETVLAMGIAVSKNKGLAASFYYAEGLLKINERTHDAASLLETLREADEKMSQVIVGWSPTKSVKQVASKSSTVEPVTAPAEPARTVQVESAPAAAPVAPVAAAAPVMPTAERSSAPNDCTTVVICVQQTLAAARDADIDQVRKIATTLDSMPKPNLGNRPIARQLNQSGIEALKRDDLPVALDKLRQALAENPRDVEVAGNLGYAMVKSGQATEAVEVLQAAVVIDPRRTSTWTPLAEAYALAGRREDARAALWVSFQWSANREKSLSFYQDRMTRETRPQLQALYSHMVGVAQEQMASPK